jgi:hypothetical protein
MRISGHKVPADLAQAVANELIKKRHQALPMAVLKELFDTLYFASLRTEESQPVTCYIVYIDPDNPDPKPPRRIVKDRWNYVSLGERILFNASSLVKIAKASDPRTSSFAVYHDKNQKLFIWGLVDQGNRYHEFINFDNDAGPERPGLFQASILGVGHLVAYYRYDRIAELHVNKLILESHDVLRRGPISELLKPGIGRFVKSVARELNTIVETLNPEWVHSMYDDWIKTICRLLLRMRNYHHGGSLLFTPDSVHEGLSIKYQLRYNRLHRALQHIGIHRNELNVNEDMIFQIMESEDAETIPLDTYLGSSIAGDELHDSSSELDGAIWFVSLLSKVDGLVLLTFDLEVIGFGVEILKQSPPPRVLRSITASATGQSLRPADYLSLGTRHRSMMRYCYAVPGSLGFVVSQDGDIRVMTRIRDDLVFWDSIRLQLDQFIGQKRAFRSGRPVDPRNDTRS